MWSSSSSSSSLCLSLCGEFSAAATERRRRKRDEVYVAAMALRGTKGPSQWLMSAAANSLNLWDFQHFMVILKHHSSPHLHQALVCDFQPKDPENIWVAATALSGREVPGVVLVREIGKLPKRKCWFVGYSNKSSIETGWWST
ncbi:uncharacterized protein LOC127247201 isoform X2 [Andrographis paniculata]|uniref:uncharacterized protein LOC127247201 isoform X2 n=1 Tax=Andrographis paniculata TaxID=175694 RepID=UPI0021E8AD24|nr:uncharacterized protein LOC127247201 isoform X2 [Andrographis paniculata]